jgi:hypothetical protein
VSTFLGLDHDGLALFMASNWVYSNVTWFSWIVIVRVSMSLALDLFHPVQLFQRISSEPKTSEQILEFGGSVKEQGQFHAHYRCLNNFRYSEDHGFHLGREHFFSPANNHVALA